jgi:hypothetical protein
VVHHFGRLVLTQRARRYFIHHVIHYPGRIGTVLGVFISLILILFLLILPVIAIGLQLIPRKLAGVTFRETAPDNAWLQIAQYAQGTFEQRFGYPTGYFYVDEKRSSRPSRILVREAQPSGTVTDGCAFQLGSVSMSGFDAGCGAGCLTFAAVALLGAPFFLVSFFDRFYRLLLRSRINVTLDTSGSDTVAEFSFFGPGGYSMLRRYAQVFHKPVLPASLQPESAVATPDIPAVATAPPIEGSPA